MLLLTTILLRYINFLESTNKYQYNYNIQSQRIFYELKDKNENNLQKIIDELKNIDKLFTH
jgi:hypothetical protein